MRPIRRDVMAGLLAVLVLCAGVAAYAPIYPVMPSYKIDPSWMLGLNQALSQGLVFGRDIVFIMGPYSTLYSQAYHPANYTLVLVCGVLLGLGHGALLLMASSQRGRAWLWACALFLLLLDSRDALFFSYPLLVLWLAWLATLPTTDARHVLLGPARRMVYLIAIALLGLLPITKVSFLPLACTGALGAAVLFWRQGARAIAGLVLALPLLTMLAAWRLAGQPVAALAQYLYAVLPMVAGYNEAMSSYPSSHWRLLQLGAPAVIAAYLVLAIALMARLWRFAGGTWHRHAVLLLCTGLYLFIAFKAGVVRQDSAHVVAAGAALLLAVLALKAFELVPMPSGLAALAVAQWLVVHGLYIGASLEDSPVASLAAMASGSRMGGGLRSAFDQQLAAIHRHHTVLALPGSSDIYPMDLAALIASGNRYAPRPVPQSYAVYTPELAQRNADWLAGPRAPDNVVLSVSAIDQHLPSMEDGLSWPHLLSHYALSGQDRTYLYFKKQPTPMALERRLVLQTSPKTDALVSLPALAQLLFAQIDIQPSLPGRLANLFFKTGPLYLTLDTANGQSKTFRFIPGMARGGFILSPLIQTNTELVQLLNTPLEAQAPNAIQSLRISAAPGCNFLWQDTYTLKLFALQANASAPVLAMLVRQGSTAP